MRRMFLVALMAWPALAGAQEGGPVFLVSDSPTTYRVRGAVNRDGSFVVTWLDVPSTFPHGVRARRFDAAAQPLGPSFAVSTDAVLIKHRPALGAAGDGSFTAAWAQAGGPVSWEVRGRRYGANGLPLGAEFTANAPTVAGGIADVAVASDASGRSAIAWSRAYGFGGAPPPGIYARMVDASGAPQGGEFQVASYLEGVQGMPAVAFPRGGGFVIAWSGTQQDGSDAGVFARRYDGAGTPVGGEFQVNAYTTGVQSFPAVAAAGPNGFVIAWISSDGADDAGPGVFAREYDGSGVPLGPEFRVSSTPVRLARQACSIVPNLAGGYAIAWSSGVSETYVRRYDVDGDPLGPETLVGVAVPGLRREDPIVAGNELGRMLLTWSRATLDARGVVLGPVWPMALAVDEAGPGDHNGVLDPGEIAAVAPTWMFHGLPPLSVTGAASAFTGPGAPANPQYTIEDGSADYGSVGSGTPAPCQGDCYALSVSAPTARPQRHMDATFTETLGLDTGGSESKTWRVHIGGSFDDVPRTSPFYRFAETLMHNGVSTGCGATTYCPASATTREQMAAFLLAAKMGAGYQPPRPPQGLFTDVPATSPFAPWIEDLALRQVASGCGGGQFCPQAPVTRAQMAVMVLRAVEGASYAPGACVTAPFDDVPCSDPFAAWIAEIARRGITAGCGGGAYCPGLAVTREQMAVFLARGFSLPLYGP